MTENSIFNITLIRHGESIGNLNGLIQGQSDHDLTEAGICQAVRIAQHWVNNQRKFDLIITSPLSRARQTAEIIAERLNTPVEQNPLWMERGFGDIDGRDYSEIIHNEPPPDFHHPYLPPAPGAESLMDTYHRAGQAIRVLISKPAAKYLVVSHGALINMVMYVILGISPHSSPRSPRFYFANTGFIDLQYLPSDNLWRILRFVNPEIEQPR